MAARLGEDGNRQALAHFITTSPWEAAYVRARLAWRMQQVVTPTALIVDEEVGHVEKWQLALDVIDETRSWGIEVFLVVADGGYGDAAAFRLGLEKRGLDYWWASPPRPLPSPNCLCAGCWPNSPPPSPNPSSSGCPTCPPTPRWPPSCAPQSCAGASSTTTAK
ncbi:transposase [Streptomyces zagrosensis]|uniref:SRSO17 transposase n=1 Tax=Streptomyces zagrosensis TaxID=1042984 RepID=A0A7W9QI34_9ACTN|nr:SRSO17 transposase [Streptomyces zagrosensis]